MHLFLSNQAEKAEKTTIFLATGGTMFGNFKKRNTNGKYVKYSLAMSKNGKQDTIIPPITVAACSFKMINTASGAAGQEAEGLR